MLEQESLVRKDMERKYNNDLDDRQRFWSEEDKRTNDRLVAQITELRSTISTRDTTIVDLKTDHT